MKLVKWNAKYLQELVDLWNKELGKDFPLRTELFEQNSFNDVNVCWEGSLIALNDAEKVIGFIVAKRWQETTRITMPTKTGWIQALVIDHHHRHKGIGSQLLAHAEATLRAQGMEEILLGRDPWHYFPGVPVEYKRTKEWFEAKGYVRYVTEHDLLNVYALNEPITEPEIPGVVFDVLCPNEKHQFLAFMNRCFPGRWEYEAMKYFERGGNGHEFMVIKKHDNIIGFCRINDSLSPMIAQNVYWAPLFEDELGGVGPLGVDNAERGHGYGLAIVKAGIAELRKRGINRIVIDWTGLVNFYKKLGYDSWKSYDSYNKSMK